MRSIYLTEEHETFRRTVRQFLEAEVAPCADAWEEAKRIPREVFRRMGEMGFLGILFPEAYGGADASIFHAMAFLEELPRSRMGGFVAAVTVQEFIVTGAIHRQGTEELKQRYLVPSIEGRKVGAIAISEPDAGSDVAAIRTRAVKDGDSWVINGAKTWITNGVEGDFIVVAAKTDPAAGAGGISLIVVDGDTPGVTRNKLRKMGWHSSDTAELAFTDVRVPLGNLVGEENQGFYSIMQTFALERLVTAATSIGGAQLCLEETLAYMASRQAFGKPISKFQALRHRLADLFTELEAARQLVYHTAWLWEEGEPAIQESSMSKLLASELAKRVADECLQFYGGFGTVEEYPMARFYRDARIGTIVAGTSEIMREIVAKTAIDGVKFDRVEQRPRRRAPAPAVVDPTASGAFASVLAFTPPSVPALAPPPPVAAPTSLPELFETLPQRHRPEKTAGWSARFHFKFKDAVQGSWTVVIDNDRCETMAGHEGTPDCVVTTTEKVYLGIEAGTQSPETAFLLGKVKVSNVAAMNRFIRAFRKVQR